MLNRKNVILVDFNNLVYRAFFTKEVSLEQAEPNFLLWKYMVVNNIYRSLYKVSNVSDVVLAVDDFISWRKVYWGRYKESRKIQRDKTKGVNWQIFFDELNNFMDELKENLPFKTIKIQSAEADDIIAILCMEKKESDYVIISNDEDFLQLTSLPNVKLFCPNEETYIKEENTESFIAKLCLMGQKKDDIFNIRTPLDWPQGKRKPPFGDKMLRVVMAEDVEKWIENNNLVERYKANKILVDFRKIPQVIRKRILDQYETYELPDPSNMYKFFSRNKMKGFLDEYDKVEQKLMSLY